MSPITVLLSHVALVNEARNHVAVLHTAPYYSSESLCYALSAPTAPEVVVRAVDVGGDDRGVVAAVLLLVAAVHHVDHAFGIGVSFVGSVRRAVVDLPIRVLLVCAMQ